MSGFTPIEFTKAATKEGGKTPTNEEKDADALQRVAAAFGSAPEMKADSADPGSPAVSGRCQWFWFDEAGVNGCGLGGVL